MADEVLEAAAPPREVFLLLAAFLAAACGALTGVGALRGWTRQTLAVLFALGAIEAAIATGLVIRSVAARGGRRRLVVTGVTTTVVAAFFLAGVVLLSGRV